MNPYLIAIICLLSTFGAVSGGMALYFFYQFRQLFKEYQEYVKKEIQEVADSANISTDRLNQAGIGTALQAYRYSHPTKQRIVADSPSEAHVLSNLYRNEADSSHSAYPDQRTQHHE